MIPEFVQAWDARKGEVETKFKAGHPGDYQTVVKYVVEILRPATEIDCFPDPARIEGVTWGDYQGTLAFVIGGGGHYPHTFWYVLIDYGSCSGCDTLEGIRNYGDGPPTEEQVSDYMMLALHVLQGLKEMES